MDQLKTGSFLKELRREKNLTQEQLAEKFNTTNRSVSRWETGKNLPDISLLVELADFYDVDVREIIDGERKSEMMDKEVKEVAEKMADYSDEQSGRLLIWVRRISFIGLILIAAILRLQTISYNAQTLTLPDILLVILSVAAFIVMGILTLYTNGKLEKLVKRRKFVFAVKTTALITGCLVTAIIISSVRTMINIIHHHYTEGLPLIPYEHQLNIEEYDKDDILKKYGGDIHGDLRLFPDTVEKSDVMEYDLQLRTILLDTDGYILIRENFNHEDWEQEVKRLSEIGKPATYTIYYGDTGVEIPAVVTLNGYDYEYEYALFFENNHTIYYIYTSNLDFEHVSKHISDNAEYLKPNFSEEDVPAGFNIYE